MSDFFGDLDLGDLTAGEVLKGAMDKIIALAMNPASMPLASILIGYALHRSRVPDVYVKEAVITTVPITQSPNIPLIAVPSTDPEARLYRKGNDGFDLKILDLPEETGEIKLFGSVVDLLPIHGSIYISDLLIWGGFAGLTAPVISSLSQKV